MNDTITPAELQATLDNGMAIQLLDVRRKDDLDAEPALIPGAVWHDPAQADTWAGQLRPDQAVVIYCARGGSVSKATLATLRAQGLTAQYVAGGLAGWQEHGGEVMVRK
jgi:rhodanese-related sulfurtransferase